jgi:hypothetical protein
MAERISVGNKNIETFLAPFHGGFQPAATSFAMAVAGRVYLAEFIVEKQVTIDALAYVVGGVAAGNVTLGIYGPVATREVSSSLPLVVATASTAQGTINTPQVITVAETLLQPGLYYVCIEGSDATGTFMRQANTAQVVGWGSTYDRGGGYGALTDPSPATTDTGSNIPGLKIRCKAN